MLFVVATPIGNLGDISERALGTLRDVDVILCEDTRVTKKLLAKYEIHTDCLSYHSNSGQHKYEKIIEMLERGKDLALVSDAGTPTISDPGARLVSEVYERLGSDVKMVAIPGPSAVISALSLSGLPASDFLFLGFLPRKKGRNTLMEEIAGSLRTVAFYESPHRILKTLQKLSEFIGEDRVVVLAREVTKIHEEVLRGPVQDILNLLEKNPEKVRGEYVVMVSGRGAKSR